MVGFRLIGVLGFWVVGTHKWRLRGSDITSDGLAVVTDGEMDLATRTYNGTIYE